MYYFIKRSMNFFSPLEQFEINPIIPLKISQFIDISITNSTIYTILAVFLAYLFILFGVYKSTIVPVTRWQSIIEFFYEFVYDIVKQQNGLKGQQYFPVLFSTFMFILFCNFLGLMPFAFTVTSHIIVTFLLALAFNLGFILLGFQLHKLKFLGLFVPSNVPSVLLPLIVVIEVVSYLIRTFSLSLRLFANMMAGHTLLNILSSFVLAMAKSGIYFAFAIIPFALVLGILVLEFGIAFLQAYVFLVLLCIYLSESLNPSH